MDIVFGTNNNFCRHAGVAIASLLDTNRGEKIVIHLLCIDVEPEQIARLESVVADYEATIKVYPITAELFEDFPDPGVYSLASYLRLLTPGLLEGVTKAMYLDCDIVVRGALRELYDTDISAYSLAGIHDATFAFPVVDQYIGYDCHRIGYINSGVLLMNLDYWRKHDVSHQIFKYLSTHPALKFPDQDAINAVLQGTILFVHPKWNTYAGHFHFPPKAVSSQKRSIKKLWSEAQIVHFTGHSKPWNYGCANPYRKEYLHYLQQTPWRDVGLQRVDDNRLWGECLAILRHIRCGVARFCSHFY